MGSGAIDPQQALVDLLVIANGDTGVGVNTPLAGMQEVTYVRSDPGIPAVRLDSLVSVWWLPDYGQGTGPQVVPIVIVPVLANFTFNDGTSILAVGGRTLPPSNSGLAGAGQNPSTNCLVVYDTTQRNHTGGYCVARAGTGTLDLPTPRAVLLYHELSHAFRIVNNNSLALTSSSSNVSSPEENAAITEENVLRTQLGGSSAVLRDANNHSGAPCPQGPGPCCIIASVASGSSLSDEVAALRRVRDGFLRRSEIGYAFFERLLWDYYGFSPQVCTLMAGHPEVRALVLEGFVRPLVMMLSLMEELAIGGADPIALGNQFKVMHHDDEPAVIRLETLSLGRRVLAGDDVDLPEEWRELSELLAPALRSDHLRWGLVEPIAQYESLLAAALSGSGAEELGRRLEDGFEDWAAAMPLDDLWGALTVAELQDSLAFLDTTLLRSQEMRVAFRDRLRQEVPTATVLNSLDGKQRPGGENG